MVWPIFFLHSLWHVEMLLNLSGSGIPKKAHHFPLLALGLFIHTTLLGPGH